MGRPVGFTVFGRAVFPASLLLNLDRSSHRINPSSRAKFNNNHPNRNSVLWISNELIRINYKTQ